MFLHVMHIKLVWYFPLKTENSLLRLTLQVWSGRQTGKATKLDYVNVFVISSIKRNSSLFWLIKAHWSHWHLPLLEMVSCCGRKQILRCNVITPVSSSSQRRWRGQHGRGVVLAPPGGAPALPILRGPLPAGGPRAAPLTYTTTPVSSAPSFT